MYKKIKPREAILVRSAGALAFYAIAGHESRKHNARTVLGRMETLAGQLYNALCPLWIVHAAPVK